MANTDLFRSLSPVFWLLRLTGGTPFFHSQSVAGVLVFRWHHPQAFWFAFVTLLHLSFVSAQVFGGLFHLTDNSTTADKDSTELFISPAVRLTNSISQARFLIDTFLLSKFIHFHLASLQAFFENLNCIDSVFPMPFIDVHRTRKIIVTEISINIFWVRTNFRRFIVHLFGHVSLVAVTFFCTYVSST